ncbi:ribosome biogenesis regulatory protein homolog [Acanthaster planci]|uniref:Ribosome biogenesis regulatory protein n=1 Tax=Acanthaster planci TaxID=133434 RepID=A0A8B7YAI9_ACAPL|nr:ribosome biogenesis regulatory protein homolog [Acanthaster planci]
MDFPNYDAQEGHTCASYTKMATGESQQIVENVLKQAELQEKRFKTTEVVKALDVDLDLGNLLAVDPNPVNVQEFRQSRDSYLASLTRDNTQLLFNEIWKLPVERIDDVIVAKMPDPTTNLPREKHVPKPKPLTRWEQYSKVKGIKKRKKGRKVWDEEQQKWVPRWGYGSKNDDKKDWVLEVPDNADPYEDQFAKRKKEKRERVAKNDYQRLRNIARAQKLKIPGPGVKPKALSNKAEVNLAIHAAKHSTASIGKFEQKLPKEPITKQMGKKRKFEPLFGDIGRERNRELAILDSMNRKKPKLDVTKAMNKEIKESQAPQQAGKGERRKGKTGKKTKTSKKALPKTTKRKKGGNTKKARRR